MLELLSVFAQPANSVRTLMNAANLAAVLQPCLLVHPGHIADPHEYTRAKDVVEFLIVHAGAIYGPRSGDGEPPAARLVVLDMGGVASTAADRTRAMTCGEQSVDGDCDRATANDDGATLDAHSNGPPSPHHSSSHPTPWAQAPAHDSGSAVGYSHDLGARAPYPASMCGGGGHMSAVPADDAHAGPARVVAPMVAPAPEPVPAPPQPLGSVTARLFDPASAEEPRPGDLPGRPRMDTYDSWHAGQSSLAMSSIHYEHTATSTVHGRVRGLNRASVLPVPDSPVDVRPPTRPRRSMSFVAPSPTSDRKAIVSDHTGDSEAEPPSESDDGYSLGPGRGHVDMDAFTHDMMSRSSNAARARRNAGERRAGHVHVRAPCTADDARQAEHKPLPTIPRAAGSGASGPPVSAPTDSAARPTSASKLRRIGPFAGAAPEPAGFPLYPRAQPVQMAGPGHHGYRNSGIYAPGPVADQEQPSKYGGPGAQPVSAPQPWAAATAAPEASNNARAQWLSEEGPEDDYEFVGGRQPLRTRAAHSSETELHRHPAAGSATGMPPQGVSDAQLQMQRPADRPEPPVPHRQGRSLTAGAVGGGHEAAAAQLSKHKALRTPAAPAAPPVTEGGKDKVSMTRLKSLFRMGGTTAGSSSSSISSSGGGGGISKDAGRPRAPAPAPLAVSSTRGDATGRFPQTISSPRFTAKGFQQPSSQGGLPRDAVPASSFELANRLHVTVPAAHLSIVYPDSPMSKADTLRRSSTESYSKQPSAGIAASSGHAYLVDPGRGPDPGPDPDDEDLDNADGGLLPEGGARRFHGADLHTTPSNTTTLRPMSQLRQQQQPPRAVIHDSYTTLGGGGGGGMAPSAPFLATRGRDCNVAGHDDGSGSSSNPRMYAMQRRADSDTQLAQFPSLSRAAAGAETGSEADAYVLPSIGGGSPLMPAFGFDARDMGSPAKHQLARPYDAGREHRLAQQLIAPADEGDTDDAATGNTSAANSPRRSRSLRNTITSLRRKLSRSSRNSADVTPAAVDDHAPTTSVH
ncbi:GTPase activating protein (GAP) for Rho1p [Coemansia nantahalensis]|nr:GTPase activating protein (GAP) for Rho1p [Coemansia nantahalensis]